VLRPAHRRGKASGKDTERPQLQALLQYAREGDTIVVHSMDRLARNLDDLRRLMLGQTKRGVRIQFVKESLTFTAEESPMANLLLSVMGAFAEFERALIKERQREGITLARQRGAYLGRRKSVPPEKVAELRRRSDSGEKKAALAREFGISRETLYQYLRQETAAPASGRIRKTTSVDLQSAEHDFEKIAQDFEKSDIK
jgi:DNA invertase Pin-like site-specific DNA recombinase